METYELATILATGMFVGIFITYYLFKIKNALKKRKRRIQRFKRTHGGRVRPAVSRFKSSIDIQGVPFVVADPLPMDSYDRKLFGPPISEKLFTERFTPRDMVLMRDGGRTVQQISGKIYAGTWKCPYSGSILTQPGEVEIDHIVPLAEAWRSGARNWPIRKRVAFARATDNLITVSKTSNRAKSDSDITRWLPMKNQNEYIVSYLSVKQKYGLSLNRQEAALLRKYFN